MDLSRAINTLANLGVIAGIVFLGFEIRQNNENLSAQSRYNHASELANFFYSLGSDRELSSMLVRARSGEQLDAVETFQLEHIYIQMFKLWQWEYDEHQRGRIEAPTDSWISILRECPNDIDVLYPGVRQTWESSKGITDDAFISFIDNGLATGGC